jgi:hypothetical protein
MYKCNEEVMANEKKKGECVEEGKDNQKGKGRRNGKRPVEK